MSTGTKPHSDVVYAWKKKKRMEKKVHHLWRNGAQIMDMADRLLERSKYDAGFLRARIYFLREVVRCHGPDTRVDFIDGKFSLRFSEENATP